MREITIISPHRDDAVFSLAITLRTWCNLGVRIRVANFFTYSAYAPRAVADDRGPAILSNLRRREDRIALRALHPAIAVRDWRLMDAPLRLGRATAEVIGPNSVPVRAQDVLHMRTLLSKGYTVAPLGLGDHVDHRTARDAAIEQVPPHRLAFYEDLPYAIWAPEDEIRRRIAMLQKQQRRAFRLAITPVPNAVKRRLVALYATQVTPEEAAKIALRNEKIWIPAHSRPWFEAAGSL